MSKHKKHRHKPCTYMIPSLDGRRKPMIKRQQADDENRREVNAILKFARYMEDNRLSW